MKKKNPRNQIKGFKIIKLPPETRKEFELKTSLRPIRREIPFSQLTQVDKEGKRIRFEDSEEASDKGEFIEILYSEINFELITKDLPPKEKEVVKLRYKIRLSNKEIGQDTKSKTRTIEQRLYRAYKKIRAKINGKK